MNLLQRAFGGAGNGQRVRLERGNSAADTEPRTLIVKGIFNKVADLVQGYGVYTTTIRLPESCKIEVGDAVYANTIGNLLESLASNACTDCPLRGTAGCNLNKTA